MGYVTISNELVDELSPAELLVYVGIKRHYPKAHPSLDRIAKVIGVSLATVKRALKSLRDRGLILVRRTGRANWYVALDDLPKAPPDPSDGSHRAIRQLTLSHKEEQLRTPSEETKTLFAARQETPMPAVGQMPEDQPPEDEREAQAKAGRVRVILAWRHGAQDVGVQPGRWNKAILNTALADLRKRGYTDDEILILLESFFLRDPQGLRTKSREHDLAIQFRQALNSGLEARCEEAIRRHRSGEGTVHDTVGAKTREIAEEYMRRANK